MNIFKRTRIRYLLHRHAISRELWAQVTDRLALLNGLTSVEKSHLRELATLFLHEKNFTCAPGLNLTESMRVTIAVQACLPILGLGLGCLSGWTEIVVYPSAFRVARDTMDSAGVVHHVDRALVGESWFKGPLILSWQDVEENSNRIRVGHNVVIHEIAHKLDMLNGSANGFPPLHHGMDIPRWSAALNDAYQSLVSRIEHHHRPCVDAYAATNPAEFFAVLSEYFFCDPETLQANFPEVYKQFVLYYRQDPWQRNQ